MRYPHDCGVSLWVVDDNYRGRVKIANVDPDELAISARIRIEAKISDVSLSFAAHHSSVAI